MSKKPDASKVAQGTLNRLQASKIFFSGELDAQRIQAIGIGDTPWRILRYQRIVEPEKLGYPIAKQQYTRPATFENHLKYLSKHCRIVPLDHLVELIATGANIPDKTVAITLDGGWIDNFVYAYPALLKAQIPATYFVATGFLGTMNYFWQEKLMFALLIMRDANIKFIPFDFLSQDESEFLANVSPDYTIDFPLILSLTAMLETHSLDDRIIALQALGAVAHQLGGLPPAEPAFMSWEDAKLCLPQIVTFGSWGHLRTRYDELSEEDVRTDLKYSYEILRSELPNVSKVFAYPEGYVPFSIVPLLTEVGATAGVGVDSMPSHIEARLTPPVYPRLSLYEGNSYCTEILACKLWLRT